MDNLSRARLMGITGSLIMAVIFIFGTIRTILKYLERVKLDSNLSLTLMPRFAEITLSVIGAVLVCIAIYQIGKVVKDHSIFKNYLLGIGIIYIVGSILAAVGVGILAFFMIRTGEQVGIVDVIRMMTGVAFGDMKFIEKFRDTAILRFSWIFAGIAYITNVSGYHYLRKSYVGVGESIGTGLFSLAGNFFFWGAVCILLFGLGGIAMGVGQILLLFAFIKMPVATPKVYTL